MSEEKQKVSRTRRLVVIVLVLAAAAALLGLYYYRNVVDTGVEIPDFLDLTSTEVKAWMEENSLDDSQVQLDYEYDENEDAEAVLYQSIAAGQQLHKSEVLTIILSNGKDPDREFTLPDFTDKEQSVIMDWFDTRGFTNVTYVFETSDTVAENVFLSSDPAAETKVKRSDAVTITISSGDGSSDEEVTVPDFSSYTKANMQAWGATNSITMSFTYVFSDTVSAGGFIKQSVEAGTKVTKGSKIVITLSYGKAVVMEDLVGSTRTAASQWCSDNSLKASYTEVYSDSEAGLIVSQSVSAGTQIAQNTTVSFQVSIGPVSIDDYTGHTKDAFLSYISGINGQYSSSAVITVTVQEEESDETAGTILWQSASGTVSPGTTITITVAKARSVTVTSCSGSTVSEFTSYLSSVGLNPGVRSESYHDTIASGCIISNDTGTYPVGSSINYSVSLGAYTPDSSLYAAGASYSSLSSAIDTANSKGAGWTLNVTYQTSSTYDSGRIIACSVSGKTLNCTVSSGIVKTVPNVVGMTYTSAKSTLESAGFTVVIEDIGYDSSKTADIVFAQSPAGNSTAGAGATVTIRYSDGPEPVQMATLPNIYQYYSIYAEYSYSTNVAKLTALFQNAGFTNIQIIAVPTGSGTDYANQNGVQSISPTPDGSTIPASTEIDIYIYQPQS